MKNMERMRAANSHSRCGDRDCPRMSNFDPGPCGHCDSIEDDEDRAEEKKAARAGRQLDVYAVEEREGAPAIRTRVGYAIENADGTTTIKLSAYPVSGRLVLVEPPK